MLQRTKKSLIYERRKPKLNETLNYLLFRIRYFNTISL